MGGGVVCRGDDSTTLKLNDTRLRVKRVKLFCLNKLLCLIFTRFKVLSHNATMSSLIYFGWRNKYNQNQILRVVIDRSNEFNGHQELRVMIGRSTFVKKPKIECWHEGKY